MYARICSAIALWLFVVGAASAEIDPARICNADKVVDKKLLAAEILDSNKISHRLVRAAEGSSARPTELDPMQYLIARGELACGDPGFACAPPSGAAKSDKELLGLAQMDFNQIKLPPTNTKITGIPPESEPREFFLNNDIVARCVGDEPAPAAAQAVAKTKALPFTWRVRGKSDDLFIPQGDGAFKAVDKATLNLAQDDIKGRRVRTVNGVVGAAFRLSEHGLFGGDDDYGYVNLIPYFGIASNITKDAGKASAVTGNTRQFGITASGYETVNKTTFMWAARTQYTRNLADDSRLVTASLRYLPIAQEVRLNSPRQWRSLWTQWLFDARYYHGNYTSTGSRTREETRDFDRIGAQVGFALSHVGKPIPWDLTVTETGYYSFAGPYQTLAQFKTTFAVWLDERKLAGIDLSYTNGRDGETALRDKSWKFGIGFKY